MGCVFRKAYTKRVPPDAEVVVRIRKEKQRLANGTWIEHEVEERIARWRDKKEKTRTAALTTGKDGSERIALESRTYFARYRSHDGIVVEKSTGCRDEGAARQVLAEWERRVERIRAGLLTPAEDMISRHQSTPLAEHFDAYLDHMKASGSVRMHRDNTRRFLNRVAADCGFTRLGDLRREALERWLVARQVEGMSARARNSYRTAIASFANWCCEPDVGRLVSNPFRGVAKADERSDPRRKRRAMTEDELIRLLEVARQRPLQEAMTVRKGNRKGERYARVRPDVLERLEALGRERALIYKALVLTGLRKNELATLAVAQLRLDVPIPYVDLDAADEKNRAGSSVVIRADLAEDLRGWLDERLASLQEQARDRGEPIPAGIPGDSLVFQVPDGLVRIFDRDLEAAGIPKRDDRGRTLDVHALRTTFGTLLSRGGVPLRTAQAAMRHSDPSLTANVYTDPRLLDVAGSLDALPGLPLGRGPDVDAQRARATGTDGSRVHTAGPQLALPLARNEGAPVQAVSSGVKTNTPGSSPAGLGSFDVSSSGDDRSLGLATPVHPCHSVGAAGFEPTTSRPPV
jgi:integrase